MRIVVVVLLAVAIGVFAFWILERDEAGAPETTVAEPTLPPTGWEKIYDHPADSATSIDMLDDEFGLAVIGHTLHRTDDGGRNWQQIESAGEDVDGILAISDRNHAWLAVPGSILRTVDGGRTWREQRRPTSALINGFVARSDTELWLTAFDVQYQGYPPHGDSAFLRLFDGGESWSPVALPGYGIFLDVWFIESDGWVIATQCKPGDPTGPPDDPRAPACIDEEKLLYTGDAGASWELVGPAPTDYSWIDREAAYAVCTGTRPTNELPNTFEVLCATTDGGRTWVPRLNLDSFANIAGVGFENEVHGWIVVVRCEGAVGSTCDNAIRFGETIDGGLTWVWSEPVARSFAIFDTTSSFAVAGVGDTAISYYGSSTGWRSASTEARPEVTNLTFTSSNVGYGTSPGSVVWSTGDGGETWTQLAKDAEWYVVPPGVVVDRRDDGPTRLSGDGGLSWRDLPVPQGRYGAGWVAAAAGERVWLRLDDALWRTDDAGATWKRIVASGSVYYNYVDADHGWISLCRIRGCNEILFTQDAGDSWQTYTVPRGARQLVFRTPLEGWAATSDDVQDCFCVIVTRDGGRSWQEVSTAPWSLSTIVAVDSLRLFGVAAFLNNDPPVVVSSSDGGLTWTEEFRLERPAPTRFVVEGRRIWLYYSTSKANFADGPYSPPGRTVIFRRDLAP